MPCCYLRLGLRSINGYVAGADIRHLQSAPCVWQGFWAELDTRAQQQDYRRMPAAYADLQKAQGCFGRAYVGLDPLMRWLRIRRAVPEDVPLQAKIAFGFLWICIIDTAGLLQAWRSSLLAPASQLKAL